MKLIQFFAALAVLIALASAGTSFTTSGSPKSEMVKFKSGDEMISGYLALPSGAGRAAS